MLEALITMIAVVTASVGPLAWAISRSLPDRKIR
jgi:hypothetical protein